MEEDNVIYLAHLEQFKQDLVKTLGQFRKDNRFCDVNLWVNDVCIKAHRNVLAARSAYFEAMFSGNFQESENGVVDIDMSHSVENVEHLETVVSALYDGCCQVTASNVSALYHLASFFMFEQLKDCLVDKLLSMTYSRLQNIVQAYILALTYDISLLQEKCFTVMEGRFHDHFIYEEDILILSINQMKLLFKKNVHRYCSLSKIVMFLVRWINKNFDDREMYTAESLELIHHIAQHLDSVYLTKVNVFLSSKMGDDITIEFLQSVQDRIHSILHAREIIPRVLDENVPTTKNPVEPSGNQVMPVHSNCLVLVAPGQNVISNICNKEYEYKEGKRINLRQHSKEKQVMKLAIYDMELKNWLNVGVFTPFSKFDNKNNWKAATVNDHIYFVSLHQKLCYSLCLKSLICKEICIKYMLNTFNEEAKSAIPLSVDGKLIVLVSNCVSTNRENRASPDQYIAQQKYFQLESDLTWSLKAEVEHKHSSTPASLVNASSKQVIVIKANIVISLGKNLLEIKEGHVFDSVTSSIKKFSGPCYLSSPVRLLVNGDNLHIIDADGWKRKYDWVIQEWMFPEKTDLSLVRWCRSVSSLADYPCLSHVSTNAGNAIWEIANHGTFVYSNYLLKIDVDENGEFQTTKHTPPPFRYFTLCTAGFCSNELLKSFTDSQYMEPHLISDYY
ncbi:hypothetical protein SNE40_007069 [Patella caerulea]|uniref:BTB domain-containing protein n=1 Tax=Patella caerulea TaxID=87958 RepID=A0AAN8PX07_PATCE